MSLLYFLTMILIGLGLIVYRERVQRITGNFAFAEKYLGAGGTYHFILLIGFGFIFVAILYITGGLDSAIKSTVGRFFITR